MSSEAGRSQPHGPPCICFARPPLWFVRARGSLSCMHVCLLPKPRVWIIGLFEYCLVTQSYASNKPNIYPFLNHYASNQTTLIITASYFFSKKYPLFFKTYIKNPIKSDLIKKQRNLVLLKK